jgi:hypothetical protein
VSAVARLRKLRAMPLDEILSRAAYAGYTAYERAAHRAGRLAPPDRLRRGLVRDIGRLPDWRTRAASRPLRGRFFEGVEAAAPMRALFGERYMAEAHAARMAGDAVLGGEVAFFGRTFSIDAGVDWHADPVTGAGVAAPLPPRRARARRQRRLTATSRTSGRSTATSSSSTWPRSCSWTGRRRTPTRSTRSSGAGCGRTRTPPGRHGPARSSPPSASGRGCGRTIWCRAAGAIDEDTHSSG